MSDAEPARPNALLQAIIVCSIAALVFIDVRYSVEFNVTALYVIVIFLTLSLQSVNWVLGVTLATIVLNLFVVRWHMMYPPEGWAGGKAVISHLLIIAGAQIPAGLLAYRTLVTQRRLERNRGEIFRQQRKMLELERQGRLDAEGLRAREAEARNLAEEATRREAATAQQAKMRANELQLTVQRLEEAQKRAREASKERDHLRDLTESFQRKLLPTVPAYAGAGQLALGPFYQPAIQEMQMGGDFYDAMALPGGLVGLVIGDVAGHGVEAAAQTAFVTTTMRAYATEDPGDPSRVLARVNRSLTLDRQFDVFVSLFYGVYDPKTRQICYVNAGHEPPILIRKSGEIVSLDSTGLVVGVESETEYDQREVELLPGDFLVMLTDGMTEAREVGSSDLLGWDGVAKLARDYQRDKIGITDSPPEIDAHDLAYSLYKQAIDFAGAALTEADGDNPGLNDDVALLVVVAREG